jgi:hypothetical protein
VRQNRPQWIARRMQVPMLPECLQIQPSLSDTSPED